MLKDEEHHEHVSALPSIAKITQATPNLMAISPNMTHQLLDTIQKTPEISNNLRLISTPLETSTSAIQTFLEQQEKALKTISNLSSSTILSSIKPIQDSLRDALAKFDFAHYDEKDLNVYSGISQVLKQYEETQSNLQKYYRSITPSYFHSSNESPHYYSPEMTSPSDFFDSKSGRIESIEDLNNAILLLQKHVSNIPLYWRGQNNASWGLHSKLFRLLMTQNGVVSPQQKPKTKQPYPTEDQMIQAEKQILNLARQDWRYGNMSALEIFARIQHFGGPTRLLDASCNPYIAAWFAVYDSTHEHEDHDARLFALAGYASGNNEQPDYSEELLSRDPFWFNLHDYEQRAAANWGTGSRRIVWRPPEYESRIAAQNAVFILDGIPITNSRILQYFRKPTGKEYWKRPDILAASSIYAKPFSPNHNARPNQRNLAPTYSFVIAKKAKKEIRSYLEGAFGYRESFIYPDFAGLASKTNNIQFPNLGDLQ